jgi:hypothetical protein
MSYVIQVLVKDVIDIGAINTVLFTLAPFLSHLDNNGLSIVT